MNTFKKFILILFIVLLPHSISAQDEKDEFHSQIDTIVNKLFKLFDEEIGTGIFREEPDKDSLFKDSQRDSSQIIDFSLTTNDSETQKHSVPEGYQYTQFQNCNLVLLNLQLKLHLPLFFHG